MKYGAKDPRNSEAVLLDQKNNVDLWQQAVKKEMDALVHKFKVFQFVKQGEQVKLEGYKKTRLRLIFKGNPDLCRKARCVIGGYLIDTGDQLAYFRNMKSICTKLLMLIADANGYDQVQMGDISNAYLNAETPEKVMIECEPEIEGYVSREQLQLNLSCRASGHTLSELLRQMKFKQTLEDPYVWYRPNKMGNGYDYIGTHR